MITNYTDAAQNSTLIASSSALRACGRFPVRAAQISAAGRNAKRKRKSVSCMSVLFGMLRL